MARDGKVLRTITTPSAKSGDGGTFAPRPVDLSFSPDGSKIAYSYVANSCPVASSCGVLQRSTFYTRADVSPDATPIAVYGNQFSVSDPEWVTNDRTLVFGGAGSHVNFDDLNSGEDYNYAHWFDNPEDTGDGELSRDGRNLVTTYSYGDTTTINFWAVSGDVEHGAPPAAAQYACRTSETDAKYGDPTWSPDSKSAAWGSSAGIQAVTFTRLEANPSLGGAGCAVAADEHLVFPGASQPDWGPADPPAARYVAPVPGVGAGTGTSVAAAKPSTATSPKAGTQHKLTLTAGGAASQRFYGTLKVACKASAAGTCKAVATVKIGRRRYTSKTATAKLVAGTATTLRLTFGTSATKAIKKALRRGKLTAKVTLTSGTATTTRVVTLKR
jgi:hypothetical protein